MNNSAGVIFILFGEDKVLESRQVYKEGMPIPEKAVGHKFLISRSKTNISGQTVSGPATYYGDLVSMEDFLSQRSEFKNIDTSDFQGVIMKDNLFVAVRKSDTVLPRKPSSL